MKGLKTFPKGGVHPPDRKERSAGIPIVSAAIPPTVVIPLDQHLGKSAEAQVEAGETVSEDQLLGSAQGFISAAVHSPVAGTVKEFRDLFLQNGTRSTGVVIETAEGFTPKERSKETWEALSPADLVSRIAEMGVVGLGGATFPTNVKLSLPEGTKATDLVINGVECEPYLTADHRLMLENTDAIIEGIAILKKAIDADRVSIGIEENKPDAIEALRAAASRRPELQLDVVGLHLKYPQGDEKQLLKAIVGKEVPSGGLPIHIGAVVVNVGTVNAVYEAVVLGKPLMERVVTVSGDAIANPGNFRVRVGTSISDLIEAAGGFSSIPEKIVVGGPMMGFTVYDLNTPVTKGCSGILALTAKETGRGSRSACITCGRCVEVCPMGLNPTWMFKNIDHQQYEVAVNEGLMDCKECGCCAFTCPSHIPLVHGFKLGKRIARKKKLL